MNESSLKKLSFKDLYKKYDEFMNNLYNNYTTIFTDIYNTNTKNMTVKKKIDYLEEKIHKIVICFKLRNINKFLLI